MSNEFKNRVYGCVVVKAINANYNADFNGLPRRLKSDGSFYATDKSFKWLVRNYIKKNYESEKVFFTKHFHEKIETDDLKDSYKKLFSAELKDNSDIKKSNKDSVFKNLTQCIDIRLFGAVFSPENVKGNSISIHGVVQVNHAIDLYAKGKVYTDEILAPFTAIGSMSKATEAHYIHNFSVNPKNLSSWVDVIGGKKDAQKVSSASEEIKASEQLQLLSENDLIILKNSFNNCATFYDSHSKSGVENELSIYVTLNENSMLTLPGFAQFIKFTKGENGAKNSFDLTDLMSYLKKYESEIERLEIYAIEELTDIFCGIEESIDEDKKSGSLNTKFKKYDLLRLASKTEEGKR